jgi:tetratricopeptide (TPR) repeat protein
MALSFLAQMHFVKGDIPRAMATYRESEVDFSTVGDIPELARVQGEMGYVALAAGDIAAARHHFRRALRTNDEVGSPRGIGVALFGLAATEAAAGQHERAVAIAAAAQLMSERAGVVVEHPMAPGLAERIEALRASVPKDTLESLVARGRALTPAEILKMAAA